MTVPNTEILGRKSVPAPLFTTKDQSGFKFEIIVVRVIVIVIVAVMQMAVATAAAFVLTFTTASFLLQRGMPVSLN